MRPWFRGFGSFGSRDCCSVGPLGVSLLGCQGWMNVREHRRLVTEEFEKRGRALAATLGFTSELGVFSEDKQLLETAMRGSLRNPDVAYVVIQGDAGKVLASSGQHAPATQSLGEIRDQPPSRPVE